MSATSALSVSALGSFQLARNGSPVPRFKYLDARELFVYLLFDAVSNPAPGRTPGKSKQEIGAALWGDISDAQLNARFKARLNDVRHVLGDRAWVLFENESYRFDPQRGVLFDVDEFGKACADAETAHRAGNAATEHAARQRAVDLYRGHFLQDYSTRSKKDLYGEREWYLVVREELQTRYRRALERLTALELAQGHPDAAITLLHKSIALDEYDDRTHAQLMLTLARQGKKSQALRHYHNLVKQRADTPPDAELVALFEKIKRNEPLDERKSSEPSAASPFDAAAKIPPPFQVPADLPRFVGRETQFQTLRAKLVRASDDAQAAAPLCLVGMGGIGKTTLAIHAAYRLREQFPDGVLWGNLRESEPLAILGSWERAFGCDFSSLPDLNARAASFRSLLHDKRVLVLLDDVVDASDARPLLLNGAHTRTVFTSRSVEIAAALGAHVIEMPVLDADESADLLTRVVGQARVTGQEAHAQAICELLGHLPLALDITAHRLVSRPNWTLREMEERLRAQLRRLDELQLADRAVRATIALSWDALNDDQRHILAHVGAFEARSFTAAALAFVAERPESEARDLLDGLVALSLLSFETNTRYRQHPLLADFSREKLEERQTADDGPQTADDDASFVQSLRSAVRGQSFPAHSRLAQYYLAFATQNRKNYLALEDEWDNLNVGIEIAHAQGLAQTVIDYGDVLTDAWFARGRFTDARRNYPYVMQSARELEEQDPYIAASLNWGKACIDQGDYAEAEEHLQHGLQTSREVGDEFNIATALLLLGAVSVERSEYDAAQKYLEESQGIRERIGDRVGVAETLYMQARIRYRFYDDDGTMRLGRPALEIYESQPPTRSYIVLLRLLAMSSSYQNQHDVAEQYGKRAITLAEELNDFGEYAVGLYYLSAVYRQIGNLAAAREIGEQSLPLLKRIGDRKNEAYVLLALSRVSSDLGEFENARAEVQQCLVLLQELQDSQYIASSLLQLGDIYKNLGEIDEAKKRWTEALSIAQTLNHPIAKVIQERFEESA